MTTIPASHGSHGTQPGHGDDGHGHGHGHGKYPFLAHHWDTPAQQFDAGKLGMWLFLATEVLFFGGLFVWYAVLRAQNPEMFKFAAQYLDTLLGGVNTCVLILSSLTMALAVRFAQTNRRQALVVCLGLTFLGAVGFLVIKYFEYTHKIHEHLLWGARFYEPVKHGDDGHGHAAAGEHGLAIDGASTVAMVVSSAPPAGPAASGVPPVDRSTIAPAPPGPGGVKPDIKPIELMEIIHGPEKPKGPHLEDPRLPENTHLFFGVYFAMTGLHAVHVIVGMGVIGWLLVAAMRGRFSSDYYTPVDLGGLYWHIVDLVWIFLFPLFYIIH